MTHNANTALACDDGTLGQLITTAVARYPERVAFIQDDRCLSYRELGDRISQAVQLFRTLGLQRHDTIAQLSGNRPEVFIVVAAAYVYGLRSVTLHPAAGLADHRHVLNDCCATLFIGESDYAERVDALHAQCRKVQHWWSHDAMEGKSPGTACFWATASTFPAQTLRSCTQSSDVLRLAYTGGTTGRPKGVKLSDRALMSNTLGWLAGLALTDGVRYLCPAPISHGAGSLIFPTLMRGGTVILQRGFDPAKFAAAVRTHEAQLTWLVPTMLYGLLDYLRVSPQSWPSLQTLVYSAAPATPERIREALARIGPVLHQSYGQTEAPNTILMLDRADHVRADTRQLSAAGRPYPNLSIALLNEEDHEVKVDEVGEICVKGSLVMDGYLNHDEQTAQTMRSGWLHTGDLARRDSDGLYYIVGRKKDLIISGGFNVYPREVEDVLTLHPDVVTAAVFGLPDLKWGEAVTAAVVLRPHASASAAELIHFVRERKGAICAPKNLVFIDGLPLTALGKPDKKALVEQFSIVAKKESP